MFNIRIANTLLYQTTFILLLPYPCQNMLFKCEGRAIYQPFWFCPKQFPPRCNYSFCFEYFYVFNLDTITNPFTLRCVISKYLTEPQKALTKSLLRPYLGLNYLGGQNPNFNYQYQHFNLKVPGSQNYWGGRGPPGSLAPLGTTAL